MRYIRRPRGLSKWNVHQWGGRFVVAVVGNTLVNGDVVVGILVMGGDDIWRCNGTTMVLDGG
jgi:hypothetical protein